MRAILVAGLLALMVGGAAASESQPHTVTLTLSGHRFVPDDVEVPAGQRIRVRLINRDPASEEFDSIDLGVEKDVTPNGQTEFMVGPLKPGAYSFMGELHADTASGTMRAISAP